ncbi:hypothetical protein QBC34DRAFT_404694 [Podospora aff. communis PSN243]|uniref:Uncharacterized protein n=1 Tax=Podospora aff. communis PSN243 TaxID=3040156 RepID=A0AAV9GP11_9PEZI|nr:hypothetical protein QBC34DRAFT_404694 [Podospora aff. communis PSN243]
MRFGNLLSVLGLLATVSFSAPTEVIPTSPGLAERAPEAIEARNPIILAISIFNFASNVFNLVSFFEDLEEREEQFVKTALAELSRAYPEYNILIYHNQKSQYDFVDYAHDHYELDLPSPAGTKGYEIFVLTTGTFVRAGAAGWRNWGVSGCYTRSDNVVVFGDRKNCPY